MTAISKIRLCMAWCVALLILCSLTGCSTGTVTTDGQRYFNSPRTAVDQIRTMLEAEDWTTLATYYDLSGSDLKVETLRSGHFFIETKKPEAAHPAGFWKYKHPFAPAYKYAWETETDNPDVIIVTVEVEIDQGGGLIQRGLDRFKMKRQSNGWQVLPVEVAAIE